MGGLPGSPGITTPPRTPGTAQERLAARIAAIQARGSKTPTHDNPIRQDDQRVLGEREPDVEYHQAVANLAAAFPGASMEEWRQQADGTWFCRQTGEVTDHDPTTRKTP